MKRFYRWCVITERITVDPVARFRFAPIPKALPRAIPTRRDMRRLLAEPDTSTATGLRDRAVFEVLYSSGIRVSELSRLNIDDVDLCGGFVRVLRGKGGKGRVVPLGHRAGAAVRDYLRCARNPPRVGRDRNGAPLFLGSQGRRVQPPAIERAVRDCARRAGIGMRLTPHSLRHAFATHLLQGGASIVHVQRMLGHASLTSTQIYLRVTVQDVRNTHARTHPGDRRRPANSHRGRP
jgi:integrase/recombinase XerD